ncbi:uncharacterized protein LOC134268023, partial [Saccostrea cucullata]|uniref:uncharacterized protein LOC134268023 n=1 Tax=Saccostrea cuccullata TaxID=36930 RepID=UPI002ED5BA82
MTNNAVILIGPPGFGKTQTAIHMMMTFKEEWIIRKVENYVELNYIECAKRTIVFIDNIFDGKSTEIAEWMEPLERLNKLIRSMDKNGTQLKKNEGGETKENKGEGEENEAEELNEENKGETIEKKGRKINENKEETKENKNEETIENTAGKTIERRGDPNKIKGGETTENKGEKRQENETEELNEDDKGGETIEKKGQKKEKKGEAKEYKGEVVKRENGEVKVIVTAKSGIIEEACELFNKRTIFWEDCIVNLSEEKYELKNNEKKRILLKQIEFANQKKGIRPPDLSDIFWERVTKSKAHIGFPLCAHLFAFEEAFRKKGEDFFSWPTQLVLIQIQDVVTNDKTNRIKTLLLLLLLAEIHNRNKDQESKYKPDIKNEKDCANFVKKTCRLGDYFQPLNFKNLQAVVSELTWSFIRETGENSYQFIHQSVFDA